ncbi:prepilin-type N-terminal cleavage/methylation domain-containing protein [Azomonas agilis]|uniref:Prepilin-type N-terminal cleavage/methylation domain-containing protein n=1 Tax=Azomonas agilis TaxID=116849 RepID=A0A562J0H8_9GAMM|nr:prepilin-type N-terminal cleavage/methylation domain-containing protein [Azomonas agilis]TWH76324.1 prepilin-type N-terminal cleavage/methylation domain-containing protein [Azomonas agilis]
MVTKQQQGLTLIELLVVMAIVGLMAYLGTSLNASWYNSTEQKKLKHLIELGISKTKSTAIRNPGGYLGDDSAASLCLVDKVLSVQYPDCSNLHVVWSSQNEKYDLAKVLDRFSITFKGSDFKCMAFNNKGSLINNYKTCITGSLNTPLLISLSKSNISTADACKNDPLCLEVDIK